MRTDIDAEKTGALLVEHVAPLDTVLLLGDNPCVLQVLDVPLTTLASREYSLAGGPLGLLGNL